VRGDTKVTRVCLVDDRPDLGNCGDRVGAVAALDRDLDHGGAGACHAADRCAGLVFAVNL
jgi:hypothetical protein